MGLLGTILDATGSIGGQVRKLISGDTGAAPPKRDDFHRRRAFYALLESYYHNTVFADAKSPAWGRYKMDSGLPRGIRSLWNCTGRAVDWYPGALYPGGLSSGQTIPYSDETTEVNPALVTAVEQGLTWGNWASEQHHWVAGGALRGSALLEIADDLDRGKVYPAVVHPGTVAALRLNAQGHVKFLRLELTLLDKNGTPFRYAKEIDALAIRTYREDKLYDYDGLGAERENPYQFVPYIWTKHRNRGGPFGVPVIAATVTKLENLNGLGSGIGDYIARFDAQGAIFSTDSPLSEIQKILKGGATYAYDDPHSPREEVRLFKGPRDLTVHRLIENLGLGEAEWFIKLLIDEIEADLPEIVVDQQLREMTDITGPGAERAMGEVRRRYSEAVTNYDADLVRAAQMLAAIGGWRLNTGGWGAGSMLTTAQRLFAPFDLDSYAAGKLALSLKARPLVAPTEDERVATIVAKEAVSSQQGLRDLYGPKEGDRIWAERQAANAQMQAQLGRALGMGAV